MLLSNFKNRKKMIYNRRKDSSIVFTVGQERFGVDVNQIKQVIPVMEATHIPNSPSCQRSY